MSNKERKIEEIYVKKTQHEHILLRPDTYIGSIQYDTQQLYVFNTQTQEIELREVNFVPGLYKIFDEILVNAADNFQRDKSMNMIKIDINEVENSISVWNNGQGVPIEIHKEHNVYVPEMIFGQLLTSSNYDDKEEKVTGGRNGFGAKLANIFSKKFIIETGSSKMKKHYTQSFYDNMTRKEEPIITKVDHGDFTCIKFFPDLTRFNMTRLDPDIVALFTKRAYDMAGCTDSKVKVFINGNQIGIKNFSDYVDLYLKNEEAKTQPKITQAKSDRWEVICSLSDGAFQQVSFVNSICTTKGGTHVEYIANQIVLQVIEKLKVKNKKKLTIKNFQVKANLSLFVNCLIVNPAFDSQTKETLNTKVVNFGSTYELTEKFMKQILDSGIVELILQVAQAKEEAKMGRQINGKKQAKLYGIPKLDDANLAGTKHGHECTIILTEGDSAKTLALAGIEVVGRDKYGVFPLRGKFLNVRESNPKQIAENAEITNLTKIIGLQIGKKYEDVNSLRYGSIMIMTDQDHDGSHIKGLIINFIHHFWPSLLKINGFIKEFVTPIIKVTKGVQTIETFFTIPEYENWASDKNLKPFKIKYYKGLGTSTAKEAKEYFNEIDTHQIEFEYQDNEDDQHIELAFSAKLADKRKIWLESYDPVLTFVDHSIPILRYKDFVNKELILFSVADCARSIPSLCDGFKPGQRKIMFACFKRKLTQEIKVAQLSGYVAEHSAYHHGEVSLQTTIVTLAQTFVGSNNINLLLPNGQFGTRGAGGKDAASARYIFTQLSPVTRHLFNENDDAVLTFLEEEGQSIEPEYYLPIIPLVLVNGADGIGTGWSTLIPQYNPRDIVKNLQAIMQGIEPKQMIPWYKGYQGSIELLPSNKFLVSGEFNRVGETELEITELPIGKWTRDYKAMLEEMAIKEQIAEIREYHQENRVHFVVEVPKLKEMDDATIIKNFKLQTTISMTNYVLFTNKGKLYRYGSELDILKEFFNLRKELYEMRKEFMLAQLLKDYEILFNKVKFIQAVIAGQIKINKEKRQSIMQQCKRFGLKTWPQLNEIMLKFIKSDKTKSRVVKNSNDDVQNDDENQDREEEVKDGEIPSKDYDYLLSMALWSLTEERVDELIRQMNNKKNEHDTLEKMHIYQLWNQDLQKMLEVLDQIEQEEEKNRLMQGGVKNEGKKKRKAPAKKVKGEEEVSKRIPKAKAVIPKKDPNDIPLKERLAMKYKEDAVKQSIFQGKSLEEAQALKSGPGVKRPAIATQMFNKLNADAEEQNEGPQDISMRRKRITADQPPVESKNEKPNNARKRRKVIESSSEESLTDKWSESEEESEYNDADDI